MKTDGYITLHHGSGGKLSQSLIKELFAKHFYLEKDHVLTDAAIVGCAGERIAFTTDSFVVDPIIFPGGDIGKLAICGTVNDLAVSGARPQFISCGFIIEEGFDMQMLEQIVGSMHVEAKNAGVKIVTGDTKVVEHGKCDKTFINTSGIGVLETEFEDVSSGVRIEIGDKILINGGIAEHGMAIMSTREGLNFGTDILSDCASLNHLIAELRIFGKGIKFMRDATRGGLATVLNEIIDNRKWGIDVLEHSIPIIPGVNGICDLLGFDPLYVANEGKVVCIVDPTIASDVVEVMRSNELGKNAAIIGEVVESHPGMVVLETTIGGKRIVDMLTGEQLPRIC